MELPGNLLRQLDSALVSAYPDRSLLTRMVRYGLDESLEEIAGAPTYADTVFKLVEWAVAQGRVEALVAAALSSNPKNPDLLAFDLRLKTYLSGKEEAPATQVVLHPPPGTLRNPSKVSAVQPALVAAWREEMERAARAVCRVEMQGTVQTGFLVSPRLILTANPRALANSGSNVRVRFDYQFSADGITPQEGTVYDVARQGLLWGSEDLQCALLLVRGTPGMDIVKGTGQRRGWLKPPADFAAASYDPLFVLHHLNGQPLLVDYAYPFVAVAPASRYIIYCTDDELGRPGSSGAPIFNRYWQVVGVHFALVRDPQHLAGVIKDAEQLAAVQAEIAARAPAVPTLRIAARLDAIQGDRTVALALAVSNDE